MAENRTAAQVEDEYLATMGSQLGPVYYALYKEVVWIHARWIQYRKLFAEPENVQLLNRYGGFAFKVIQDALWEQTLLHVARLTDPPKSAGKDNLSLQQLPDLIADSALRSEVSGLVDTAVQKAAFAREHRNKRLAHRDLQHATAPPAVPLRGISRNHVEQMLAALRQVMNRLEFEYGIGRVQFERFISRNDAEQLVAALRLVEKFDGR